MRSKTSITFTTCLNARSQWAEERERRKCGNFGIRKIGNMAHMNILIK